MATTPAQAWDRLSDTEREAVFDSTYDAFRRGFQAGWRAQENRPFFCTFCGIEITGETDGETILKGQDHARVCEVHPLGIENRELRAALKRYGAHLSIGCFDVRLGNEDRCVCGLDEAKHA
jgi:hypothetical protein